LFLGALLSGQMREMQHGVSMKMVYGNRHNRQKSQVYTLNYKKQNLFVDGLSLSVDGSISLLERNNIDTIGDYYDWSGKPILDNNGNVVQWAKGAEQSRLGKSYSINDETAFVVRTNLSYRITPNNSIHANILYNSFKRGVDDKRRDQTWRDFQNTRDLSKGILSLTYENLAFNNRLRTNVFFKHYLQTVRSHEPKRVSGVWEKEQIDKKIDASGYGVALSYQLLPKFFILASGERAIRLPSEGETFGNDLENEVPNYGLNPERSVNINLGFNLGPYRIEQHSINLNTSLFRRNVKGMIRKGISADSQDIAFFENLDNVEARGFDAELTYRYSDKLQFLFTTSKFNALFNTEFNENGARYSYYRQQIRNEPSYKFSGSLTYYVPNLFQKGSRASVTYGVNYVNRFLRDWAGLGGSGLNWIPQQFVNDIGLTYTLANQRWTLGLDAKNIADRQVFDNFKIQRPGRAFYAKLTYNLFYN